MAVATFDTLKFDAPEESRADHRELVSQTHFDRAVSELREEIRDAEHRQHLRHIRLTADLSVVKWLLMANFVAVFVLLVWVSLFNIP